MSKILIYQMLPRLWGEGRFSSVDARSLEYIRSLGMNHVWYTGIIRHASDESFVKGDCGSPYAISDYYDVNPYLADDSEKRMEEFEALVARTHDAGLKVILDFVPNHVARNFNGDLALCNYHDYDWTDTVKIDYGARENWQKLENILRFWIGKGADGFRCDMVELVPCEFFRQTIANIKNDFPDTIFIAEVYRKDFYSTYTGEVGFDLLYDKSGLYDTLFGIIKYGQPAYGITSNWQNLGPLQSLMLNFLENHDELRFCSPEFSGRDNYAALCVSALFNNAAFMLYFGEEIGESAAESDNGRTSIFDIRISDSLKRLYSYIHSGFGLNATESERLKRFREILGMASENLFSEGAVYDLCYCNSGDNGFDPCRHFAFLRHWHGSTKYILCNFSCDKARINLHIPQHAADMLGIREGVVEIEADAFDAAIL